MKRSPFTAPEKRLREHISIISALQEKRFPMVKPFVPQLVYMEPRALEYPLGRRLRKKFTDMGIEIRETTSHNQVRNLPGENDFQKYRTAKSTLVVGVRKTLKFDTSKPSAEYAIPLATG